VISLTSSSRFSALSRGRNCPDWAASRFRYDIEKVVLTRARNKISQIIFNILTLLESFGDYSGNREKTTEENPAINHGERKENRRTLNFFYFSSLRDGEDDK